MFNELLSADGIETALSFRTAALTILTAFLLGLGISFTYIKTHRKGTTSQSFALTVVMVPAIIGIIILLVGSNIARAFSLSGAFAIIRFRSTAGDPKDITYIFFAMAAGLACGVGLFGYAIFFTMLLCIFMFILDKLNFGVRKISTKMLKITIPEDLDYQGAFDDILEFYTKRYELKKVKTTNLGTLFELVYEVTLSEHSNQKDFIDALRCRNGNLNIILSMNEEGTEY